MDERKEVITEETWARALIHLQDTPFEPAVAHIHFCGVSFEHMAQVLIGDAHPKDVAFIVFDHIQPELHGKTWITFDPDSCQQLSPIFEFGHELIDL